MTEPALVQAPVQEQALELELEQARESVAVANSSLTPRLFDSRYHRNPSEQPASRMPSQASRRWKTGSCNFLQKVRLRLHLVRRLCTVGQRVSQRAEVACCGVGLREATIVSAAGGRLGFPERRDREVLTLSRLETAGLSAVSLYGLRTAAAPRCMAVALPVGSSRRCSKQAAGQSRSRSLQAESDLLFLSFDVHWNGGLQESYE